MDSDLTSDLVLEYRGSPFAKIWRTLWKLFPNFSRQHSPFFIFKDGAVLWNQGLGSIAFLKGNRSVSIKWSFEQSQPGVREIHLSALHQWDSPYNSEKLTDHELNELRERLNERFEKRGEKVIFR